MTGPRTAGQSVIVMAALSDGNALREDLPDERDAQVGRQEGGGGQVVVSGADSVVRAFTHMNAVFRKDLTQVPTVEANDVDTALGAAAHSTMRRMERSIAGRRRHATGA